MNRQIIKPEPSPGRSEVNAELKRIWALHDSGKKLSLANIVFIKTYYETQAEFWKSVYNNY